MNYNRRDIITKIGKLIKKKRKDKKLSISKLSSLSGITKKEIFKIEMGKGLIEIDFRDAIREIDIIPTKDSSWKRCKILQLAKDLGFFGI